MNTIHETPFSAYANAFQDVLPMEALRTQVPAAFSPAPHARTSSRYTFIPTERVLNGLMRAGFVPVMARQVRCRVANESYGRHMIRLRRRFETVKVHDTIPEVVLLNSHDGASAYHLRLGLFRLACINGLLVSGGTFPTIRVAHRHDVVDEVIEGAVTLSERFEELAVEVQRMEARMMFVDEQQAFAEQALSLRYPEAVFSGIQASSLLQSRRPEDARENLWNILNRVQEHLLKGGVMRQSPAGRLTRTRRITSIREEVRLNSGLWNLANGMLEAQSLA